jgi:hypothetical protein
VKAIVQSITTFKANQHGVISPKARAATCGRTRKMGKTPFENEME